VRFPDGTLCSGNLKPAERGWPEPRNKEEVHSATIRSEFTHWSRDVSFVIDQLTRRLDPGGWPRFAGRLDLKGGGWAWFRPTRGPVVRRLVRVRLLDERVSGRN